MQFLFAYIVYIYNSYLTPTRRKQVITRKDYLGVSR